MQGAMPEMIIKPFVFLVVLCGLLALDDLTAEAALIAQIGASVVSLVVITLTLRNVTSKIVKNTIVEYESCYWLSVLPSFMGMAGVSFLNIEFINVFLGFVGTNYDVAMFRTAVNISLIVSIPLTLIESVIPPYVTRLFYGAELKKLERLSQSASLIALLASTPPAIILIVFGPEIIRFLYGSSYDLAYNSLVAIVIGYFGVNFIGLSMQLLYSTDYYYSAFRISAFGAVLTILLCMLLIPYFGAFGAAAALGLGKLLRASLFVMAARRKLGIKTSLIW